MVFLIYRIIRQKTPLLTHMNATTENQSVVASFISFLRKQKFSEEHSEGIESKI
jgi:hypothetical protein